MFKRTALLIRRGFPNEDKHQTINPIKFCRASSTDENHGRQWFGIHDILDVLLIVLKDHSINQHLPVCTQYTCLSPESCKLPSRLGHGNMFLSV